MSPTGRAADVVLLHLREQELSSRIQAAAVLHRYGTLDDARRLFGALRDKNRYTAIRAAWGLSLMPPAIVLPLLAQAMGSGCAKEVELSAWALGAMRDSAARDLLVKSLSHRIPAVRQAAAGGLWRWAVAGYRSRAAINALEAVRGKDNGSAAIVLRHMRGPRRKRRPIDGRPGRRIIPVFERFGGNWIR